jgi:hypothetical protein
MRKSSELLKLAKNDPSYLESQHYLCRVASTLLLEGEITLPEYYELSQAILGSLDGFAYLRSFFRAGNIIAHQDDERSPSYAALAHAHWDAWIAELEAQGL